jgi:hypothetical protein
MRTGTSAQVGPCVTDRPALYTERETLSMLPGPGAAGDGQKVAPRQAGSPHRDVHATF